MDDMQPHLTGDLARAGRALAQVHIDLVARTAGLSTDELRDYERGNRDLSPEQLGLLRETLDKYGVVFLPEDDHAGYGVRQKFNSRKVKRIENWENEGGPAYEDDI